MYFNIWYVHEFNNVDFDLVATFIFVFLLECHIRLQRNIFGMEKSFSIKK